MPKTKPPGTVTHTIFLPEEIHRQVTTVAKYGEADDLIVECVAEGMRQRWAKFIKGEYKKLG